MFFRKSREGSAQAGPPVFLIVGLGNPGKEYEITRHNIGFLSIDSLCDEKNVRCDKIKFKSLTGVCNIGENKCMLMKPQTFMNNSGEAVREAAAFYKIAPENIIVIFDDVTLDCGKIRIRRKGSDGGHNGIKSIIYHLGSDNFPRIKIGVGSKPHPDYDLAAWVLSSFKKQEFETMREAIDDAKGAIKLILDGDVDAAMNAYN